MKLFKPLSKLLLTGMVLVTGTAFLISSPAMANISGSSHDFSLAGGGAWDGEICSVCHTPHNAQIGAGIDAPLWNHEIKALGGYTPYSSPSNTLDAGVIGQPNGVSRLCLSCHDGTIGIDSFGTPNNGGVMTISTFNPATTADFGVNLANDHPISFTYNNALFLLDDELWDPVVTASGLPAGGTISVDMLFGGANDQLECASCHDVHNKNAALPFMLRKTNVASALCLTCHNK